MKMKSFLPIGALLLVLSVATRAGHAELQFMTPEQRNCVNELLHSLDHKDLIASGAKIQKILLEKNAHPYVEVTIIYDKDETMITRTCTPPSDF
jgi:hypothetical protein